jgi:methylenetetrahydrofolate dehydrogenase (NADP+)/methenyltetrahydrofolate cyclohydrolase
VTAELIRGAPIAGALRQEVSAAVEAGDVRPCLVNVVVGDAGASAAYLSALDKAALKRGIESRRAELPVDVSQSSLEKAVLDLGADADVHGLMLQLPLPKALDAGAVTSLIPATKDVDGLTTRSLGAVLSGDRRHTAPATASAVVEMLCSDERLFPKGRHVVIVGRSLVVGRPLAAMLGGYGPGGDATVTICHSRTPNLAEHTLRGDIVVVAVGSKHLLTPEMVSPGAIVVDVGTHAIEVEGRWTLTGDAHPDVAEVAGYLTPVPGGVGTVTTAILMRHVAAAALPGALPASW